jgi:hypothetical protein
MAIQRSPYAVNRRNSQHAPFPGSGARVQNAALGGALSSSASADDAGGGGGIPRVVHPPGTPETQPVGPPARAPEAPSAPTAPTAPSSPSSAAASTASPYAGRAGYDAIARAYQNYLGRAGSDGEIMSHLNGGQWLDQASGPGLNSSIASIYNSPEANTFRAKPPSAAPSAIDAAASATGQPSPTPSYNQAHFGTFDTSRAQDQDKSAKDTFLANASVGSNDLRWQKKETAGAWFDQYVRPGLEARGFKVGEVIGDKAFVHTRENPEGTWIDWVEGVDGDSPRLTWQDESYGGGGAGAAGAPTPGASAGVAPPLTGLVSADPTSPDFYPKLLAHLLQQLEI